MTDKINAAMRMAMIIIGVGFLYLFLVTFMPIPSTGQDHAKTIVGFIMGTVISIPIGYYWGNSSKNKLPPDTVAQVEEAAKIDMAKITAAKTIESTKEEGGMASIAKEGNETKTIFDIINKPKGAV